MENINQIPKTLYERFKNALLMIKNTPYVTNALSVKQMTQNTLQHLWRRLKNLQHTRWENMIMARLKMGASSEM